MPVMEDTYYLPEEELQYRNYPEVGSLMGDIEALLTYAMALSTAVDDYTNGVFDHIDVDIIALKKHIDLCRSLTEVLGKAPKVCFDLLVDLRGLQNLMQTILYAYNRFGSEYVGTPTNARLASNPDSL